MREIVVLSGKGGAGKTSLSAAFAHLAEDAVVCDLDVDAPDLHILLDPKAEQTREFVSGNEALIDQTLCTACGQCLDICHFGAIKDDNGQMIIDPTRCEGCKSCVVLCPVQAIEFPEKHCGEWWISDTRFGPMVHARLFPGEENSGKLVTLLKNQARDLAEQRHAELIIADGAPGIGCPVISSLARADLAVLVTEPTPSGLHDLQRVAKLCLHFRITCGVVINKYDLSTEYEDRIEAYCREHGITVFGRLPHDPIFTQAMVQRKAVTEMVGQEADNTIGQDIRRIFERIVQFHKPQTATSSV
ncbi:ATP-binding protein [Desulfovibrio inopinatus]|uniref:ATP-binding protein n=1 Tax=Desulfovibrio inopinatus TaxID=102109 RepID=UPI000411D8FF|nr:ATP-binding protein [Desulfovibrio inopinatus]